MIHIRSRNEYYEELTVLCFIKQSSLYLGLGIGCQNCISFLVLYYNCVLVPNY